MATTRQKTTSGESTSSASSSTEEVVNNVKSSANEALGQAKEKVTEVAGQAQEKAKSQLAERKDLVAERLDHVASALRQTSQNLQGQDNGPVGDYVTRAADKLSDVSRYVRENDINQLLHEVEGFARREPAIALGSAFAIGVIAARFLKSSNQRRYDAGSDNGQPRWQQNTGNYGSGAYRGGSYGGNASSMSGQSSYSATEWGTGNQPNMGQSSSSGQSQNKPSDSGSPRSGNSGYRAGGSGMAEEA